MTTRLPGGVKFPESAASAGEAAEVGLFAGPGAPTNGTTGTLAGVAGKGSLYVRVNVTSTTTGLYQNTGTTASVNWVRIS